MNTTQTQSTFKLPEHFMVSQCDGGLYDTRKAGWEKQAIRVDYSRAHKDIDSTAKLKATLRAGAFAWPGGYRVVYYTSDSALLCTDCVKKHLRSVLWSIRNKCSDGWKVVSCGIEAVSADCTNEEWQSHCAHCGEVFGEIS